MIRSPLSAAVKISRKHWETNVAPHHVPSLSISLCFHCLQSGFAGATECSQPESRRGSRSWGSQSPQRSHRSWRSLAVRRERSYRRHGAASWIHHKTSATLKMPPARKPFRLRRTNRIQSPQRQRIVESTYVADPIWRSTTAATQSAVPDYRLGCVVVHGTAARPLWMRNC